MEICLNIKSGTGGWYSHDGCDMAVAEIETDHIPRKDDIIEIHEEGKDQAFYLVTEIRRSYSFKAKENSKWAGPDKTEFITVYVIPY